MELNNAWGAMVDGDQSAVSESCGTLIKDCTFVNCGGNSQAPTGSLYVVFNQYTSVIGCMIDVPSSKSQWHLLFNNCAQGVISSNWVASSPTDNISLINTSEVVISSNNVLTGSGNGIAVENGYHNVVASNVLRDNKGIDIIVYGSTGLGNNVSGNICLSTTNPNSIGETGSFKTLVAGNSTVRNVLLAGSSLGANNLSIS
jgi:hypothetical protein